MDVINLNEWKTANRARTGMLDMVNMMKMGGTSVDARHIKEVIFMITSEYFDTDVLMAAIEELLISGDIRATVLDTNTVIITSH